MKCAIFDFDGTLFDSMWVWDDIDIEFLSQYNIIPTKQLRQKIRTLSVHQSATLFKTTFNLKQTPEEIVSEFSRLGSAKYSLQIQPKPHVKTYLEMLQQQNIPMCIATSAAKENVTSALVRCGMLGYFDFIISPDEVKSGKNDPEIFLLCASKFGVNPKDIAVFEDSLHAIKAAKSAGFIVVGVQDDHASADCECIKATSDFYIKDFSEMVVLF